MPERPTDPAAIFRDLASRWEAEVNATMNRLMGTEEFARTMGKTTSLSVRMQQQLHEAMERYLTALNLPNRREMVALGERLGSIEAKLDNIHAVLSQLRTKDGTTPAEQKPSRTRKPAPQGDA